MKYKFFLFFYLLSFSFLSAQTDISNKEYLNKIEKFGNTNIDSLFFYAKKSQKSTDLCTKNLGYIGEASAYYKKGNFVKSEEICLKIIKKVKKEPTSCDHKILLSAYNRLFWIKKNQGKYDKAFYYLLEKKKAIEAIPERNAYYHLHKLSANNNIASIKEVLGLHNEALNILKETNKSLEKLSNDNSYYYNHLKVLHSSNLNTIGDTYFNIGRDSIASFLDSAAVYYKKAYYLAQNFVPTHKNSEQLYTLRKVKVLTQKKKFKKALETLLSTNYKDVNSGVIQDANFYKSIVYYNLKNSDSTLFYANSFLSYDKNTPNSKENKIIIFDILANQYNHLQKADSAYKYSRLGLEELSQLTTNKNKINKTHYKYNFNQIKKDNDIVFRTERKTHITQVILISVIALLLIFFLFYRSKIKRRKALQNFDTILDEIHSTENPPKKDYNIEKGFEESILHQLEELENSTDFLSCDFNIRVLAKKLETNTSYLSYIINNTKNQSFKQYITKLRIDFLINKLNTEEQFQNYTIQYLAEEIGYTNASAFTRAFKKELGTTPSEYIKSLKK
jgi:AraC-like DNA-binding protein